MRNLTHSSTNSRLFEREKRHNHDASPVFAWLISTYHLVTSFCSRPWKINTREAFRNARSRCRAKPSKTLFLRYLLRSGQSASGIGSSACTRSWNQRMFWSNFLWNNYWYFFKFLKTLCTTYVLSRVQINFNIFRYFIRFRSIQCSWHIQRILCCIVYSYGVYPPSLCVCAWELRHTARKSTIIWKEVATICETILTILFSIVHTVHWT